MNTRGNLKLTDDSAWPVIFACFEGDATPEEYDRYAAWFEACCQRANARGTRIVVIADTTRGV